MSNFIDTYGDVIGIVAIIITSWVLYCDGFIAITGIEGDAQCALSLLMFIGTCILALIGYAIYDDKRKEMENC